MPFRNDGRLRVGDRKLARQPCLAIVADAVLGGVTLAYCGARWDVVAMVGAANLEAAMRQAERLYQGLRPHWIDGRVSKREIAQYMQTRRDEEGCSFCDKAPGELETDILLFEARGARICSDCIRALHEEMRHTWRTRSR